MKMTKKEQFDFLVSPEKFWPLDIRIKKEKEGVDGNILGNKKLVEALHTHLSVLDNSKYWDIETLKKLQERRLEKLYIYLSNNSPFWKNHFKASGFNVNSKNLLHELQKLPIMNRDIYSIYARRRLRKIYSKTWESRYIINKDEKGDILWMLTSGTSGHPSKIAMNIPECVISVYSTFFRGNPVFLNKKLLLDIFSRKSFITLGIGGTQRFFSDFVTKYIVSAVDLEDVNKRKELYSLIHSKGPVILLGITSVVFALARHVKNDNVKLPIIATNTGAEASLIENRKFIKDTFSAPILERIAFTEGLILASECDKHMGNYHINLERVIIEITDEDGEVLKNGKKGNLTVTVLDCMTSPIIRYLTGDMGMIKEEKCDCGSNLPLLEFSGRRSQKIKLKSGKEIKSMELYSILMRNKVAVVAIHYQIQQVAIDRIQILIVKKKTIDKKSSSVYTKDIEQKIKSEMSTLFAKEEMNIDIIYVDNIPTLKSGKNNFFIPLDFFKKQQNEVFIFPNNIILPILEISKIFEKNKMIKYTSQFQIRQVALNKIEIYIIPTKKFTETQEVTLRMNLAMLFKKFVDDKIIIDILRVKKIPSATEGKPVFFIPLKRSGL